VRDFYKEAWKVVQLIGIGGKQYLAHRLAWFYMTGRWPIKEIDHIDGNPLNNRWNNLREATPSQNSCNKDGGRGRSLELRGASYDKTKRKWRSYINVRGKRTFLGDFETAEDAHNAYLEAARRLHGEFHRPD
jgi:hypothetical protein